MLQATTHVDSEQNRLQTIVLRDLSDSERETEKLTGEAVRVARFASRLFAHA